MDIQLYYREKGTGFPMVMLHGNGEHGGYFKYQIPIEISYRINKLFAGRSESIKKKVELLSLMVNDPHISSEKLHSLFIPTLVIAGNHDMVKDGHTREIARNIPDAKLVILEGNHFIANQKSKEYNEAVDMFLEEIGEKRE